MVQSLMEEREMLKRVKHDELLELNPNCYSIAAVSASLISEGLLDSQSKR